MSHFVVCSWNAGSAPAHSLCKYFRGHVLQSTDAPSGLQPGTKNLSCPKDLRVRQQRTSSNKLGELGFLDLNWPAPCTTHRLPQHYALAALPMYTVRPLRGCSGRLLVREPRMLQSARGCATSGGRPHAYATTQGAQQTTVHGNRGGLCAHRIGGAGLRGVGVGLVQRLQLSEGHLRPAPSTFSTHQRTPWQQQALGLWPSENRPCKRADREAHLDRLREDNPGEALSAGGSGEAAAVGVVGLVGGEQGVHSKVDRVRDGVADLRPAPVHTSAHMHGSCTLCGLQIVDCERPGRQQRSPRPWSGCRQRSRARAGPAGCWAAGRRRRPSTRLACARALAPMGNAGGACMLGT